MLFLEDLAYENKVETTTKDAGVGGWSFAIFPRKAASWTLLLFSAGLGSRLTLGRLPPQGKNPVGRLPPTTSLYCRQDLCHITLRYVSSTKACKQECCTARSVVLEPFASLMSALLPKSSGCDSGLDSGFHWLLIAPMKFCTSTSSATLLPLSCSDHMLANEPACFTNRSSVPCSRASPRA